MTTLAFLGDVMLGRMVDAQIAIRQPDSFWGTTLPVLRAADGVFINLECAITESEDRWKQTYKVFHFRARPHAVAVLQSARVRYASLANNHVLDYEERGLLDTLDHLDRAGIAHAGAGRTLGEAMRPAMIDISGCTVGVISLTDNEPAFAATAERPGTYYSPISAVPDVLEPIAKAVEQLRAGGTGLVVLSVHWGPNMVERPTSAFREFAHAVIGLGVDLVHGHSAHLFQGVERRDKGVILYDAGDFLDDYAVDPILRNDWSFIFLLDFGPGSLQRLRMIPVRLRFARVGLATSDEFEEIRRCMRERCRGLEDALLDTGEGLELRLGEDRRAASTPRAS